MLSMWLDDVSCFFFHLVEILDIFLKPTLAQASSPPNSNQGMKNNAPLVSAQPQRHLQL